MNQDRKIELLNKHPFLANLETPLLEQFASEAEVIELEAGESVLGPDDTLDGFYIIDYGELERTIDKETNAETVQNVYRRNDSFGDLALMTEAPSCFRFKSVLNSRVLKLDRSVLVEEIQNNPSFNRSMDRKVEYFFREERERISSGSGSILSIGSAESSVGKSLFGINFTTAIYDRVGADVCLIDFTKHPIQNIDESILHEPASGIDRLGREDFPGDFPVYSINFPEEISDGSLRAFLTTLSESFKYTVVILPEGYGTVLRRVYEQSDRMFFLVNETDEDLFSMEMMLNKIREDLNLSERSVEIVLNQSDEPSHNHREEVAERLGENIRGQLPTIQDSNYVDNFESRIPYVRSKPDQTYSRTVRRIAHRACGNSLGIALGSGAARGLSHIGVLEVLHEEGIEPDMVSGSSMGALIAAGYALGQSPKTMRNFARKFKEMGGFFRFTDLNLLPSQSILRLSRIRNFLDDLYGDATFDDTEIPLVITTSNINSAKVHSIREGRLADAILSSIAIPMIYPPQSRNGSTYVDGGVFEPVPVKRLKMNGINKVVAVNVIPPRGVLREQQPERLGPLSTKRTVPSFLKKFVPIGSDNLIDVGMRTIESMEGRLAEHSTEQADVVVDPFLPELSWFDFEEYETFIEQGRRSADENIDKIRSLLPNDSVPVQRKTST